MERLLASKVLLVLALTTASIATASAQSLNKQAIQQQLEHKVVLLRGRYVCPSARPTPCSLVFDRQGKLQSSARVAPFFLGAVYIDRVQFSGHSLVLLAHGAAILRTSKTNPPQFKAFILDHRMLQIRIASDASQPSELKKVLRTIFASNVPQVLNAEPPQQRKADLATLPLLTQESKAKASHELQQAIWPTIHPLQAILKKGITRPKAIYKPEPRYTDLARHDNVHGICELEFIINTQGFPQNIRVIRSLPDGLDERAIAAVSQYRFRPSKTVNGKPVPVGMIVDVDFHLH